MERSTSLRKEKNITSKIERNAYMYMCLYSHIHIQIYMYILHVYFYISIKVACLIPVLCADEISQTILIRKGYEMQF